MIVEVDDGSEGDGAVEAEPDKPGQNDHYIFNIILINLLTNTLRAR